VTYPNKFDDVLRQLATSLQHSAGAGLRIHIYEDTYAAFDRYIYCNNAGINGVDAEITDGETHAGWLLACSGQGEYAFNGAFSWWAHTFEFERALTESYT
jgi:hypothetical protein